VAVEGTAELIHDEAAFQQHWTSDLDDRFENGVNTPGIVLIKVKASRAASLEAAKRASRSLIAPLCELPHTTRRSRPSRYP
jgi:general stress protein 26